MYTTLRTATRITFWALIILGALWVVTLIDGSLIHVWG